MVIATDSGSGGPTGQEGIEVAGTFYGHCDRFWARRADWEGNGGKNGYRGSDGHCWPPPRTDPYMRNYLILLLR